MTSRPTFEEFIVSTDPLAPSINDMTDEERMSKRVEYVKEYGWIEFNGFVIAKIEDPDLCQLNDLIDHLIDVHANAVAEAGRTFEDIEDDKQRSLDSLNNV